MSKTLSPIYDKITRDLVKKYDNRTNFQAQADKFEFLDTFYSVNLQGVGTLYIAKDANGTYCLSDTDHHLLYVNEDSVEGVQPGLSAEYVYFAESLSARLYNNANSGESVKIFVGSGIPVAGMVDIRLSVTLRNHKEQDGYRAEKIIFKLGDTVQSEKEDTAKGLDLVETAKFINEATEFTKPNVPGEFWESHYQPAIATFVKAIHRIFAAEGRKVDVVED